MSRLQNSSLTISSSSSVGSLDKASGNGSKKPSSALKRTQNWVVTQQIVGAKTVGRNRWIASAHRSALYSMLDEITTMFPTIDTNPVVDGLANYDLELEIDDDDQ